VGNGEHNGSWNRDALILLPPQNSVPFPLTLAPVTVATEERINLTKARVVLDADYHDLEKVMKRVLEYLAVRKLKPQGQPPILCFVGPPGVGKTKQAPFFSQMVGAALQQNPTRR